MANSFYFFLQFSLQKVTSGFHCVKWKIKSQPILSCRILTKSLGPLSDTGNSVI